MAISGSLFWVLWIQFFIWGILLYGFVPTSGSEDVTPTGLPTVTVRGFLNFKTTVDGTVIVFTPASQIPLMSTESSSKLSSNGFLEKQALNSQEGIQDLSFPSLSLNSLQTEVADLNMFHNNIKQTFLPHISDNAVLPSVEHTNYDLDKIRKLQSSQNEYPTGLVTVLGGTFMDGPSFTVYETKVIGTYIDGKYAQILQSTSHVVIPHPTLSYSDVDPTENKEFSNGILESVPNAKTFIVSQTVKPKSIQIATSLSELIQPTSVFSSKEESPVTTVNQFMEKISHEINAIASMDRDENFTPHIYVKESNIKSSLNALESSFVTSGVSNHVDMDFPTEMLKSSSTVKISTSIPLLSSDASLLNDNIVAVTKTVRNNTSRTRFLSPRRPSQRVRLNRFKVKLTLRQDSPDEYNVTLPTDDEDLEEEHTHKMEDDVQVVTEDLAVDPARVVFQETTITSQVTLHVGRRKSVRTLTITTSIPLTVNPTDIQNILSSQSTAMDELDSDQHIVTRTFTTTERALKTSIVPIFDGKSTIYHTVTESFFIMKLITAYRTLPPGDHSILESFLPEEPEISLSTLEATSHLQSLLIQPSSDGLEDTIPIIASESSLPMKNPLLPLGHAFSNNPLAVYLGLQHLNAQMTLYSTFTDVSTYVTTETVYSTKTIRFYDGRSTRYRMISDPISTKKSTVTTTVTSVQPYLNTHAMQQQQQLQKLIAASQLATPEPKFSTITSIYTTATTAVSLSTRIYTLIYNGFSTKFRTVTSSTVYPTTVTITSTTKVLIAPTQLNLPFAYPYTSVLS